MKTLAQLESENAAAVAKLARELSIAALMPAAPDAVQINRTLPAWVTYRARTLAQALELFAAFNIAPFYECRDSFLTLAPVECCKAPDDVTIASGPYALQLTMVHGAGFGPSAEVAFYTRIAGDIYQIHVDIAGPGYIGAFNALQASPVEECDRRTSLLIARSWRANALLNGLFDKVISWASGESGPIKDSARHSYLLCADDDSEMTGGEHSHACGQLQNLIDATAPKPESI